jgi:hypothetical protein
MRAIKTLLAVIVMVVVGTSQSFGQGCNCLKVPYQPDSCFVKCSKKLLDSANKFELVLILGLSDTVANQILAVSKKGQTKNLNDYTGQLKEADTQKLFNSIQSLTPLQTGYLNLNKSDRTILAGDMDRLMNQKEGMLKLKG